MCAGSGEEYDNTKRKQCILSARWLFEHGGCCYGAVVVYSGTVVTNKDGPILIFFCGFCKRDDEDSLYGDDASKDCL
jgi:hypothetical protein